MMTNMVMASLMMLTFYLAIKNTNPMKMSVVLIVLSGLIFYQMKMSTGHSWFPMIFCMLFMGGILMMFMMVSSMMPNEAVKKMNSPKAMYIMVAVSLVTVTSNSSKTQEIWSSVKAEMFSNLNFFLLTVIMVSYFVTFLILISKNKLPLRAFC